MSNRPENLSSAVMYAIEKGYDFNRTVRPFNSGKTDCALEFLMINQKSKSGNYKELQLIKIMTNV